MNPIGPGSQQLRQFRIAIRDGATLEEACAATGGIIGPEEGKLYLAADAKNPPGPECFELIKPAALPGAANQKEADMARGKPAEKVEEVKQMDFKQAVKLYRFDIKKANSEAAAQNQEASTAYKAIKKSCHIQPDAARKAFKLMDGTEEARRDDWFRGFVGLVNEMAGRDILTFNDTDLVDAMQGHNKPRVALATIAGKPADPPPSDDSDLANGEPGEPMNLDSDPVIEDEFEEASEEELAAQTGRKPRKPSIEKIASPAAEAAE